MYFALISKIKTILEGVPAIKAVYGYPLPGNPKQYPAVIFYPDTTENSFETIDENFKIYRFKLWVVVNMAGTDEQEVYTTILPKAADAVIQAFDTAWDGGTSAAGHRIWQIIDNAGWGLTLEAKAKEAWAELNLTIKVLTNT